MDNDVGLCDGRDGEVVMTEVDCVGDVKGFGFGIDGAMAVVMLKGDANVESSEPRKSQVRRVAGLLWVMMGQSSGRRGVAL